MEAPHLTVTNIAKILGGDVRGDEVLAPGPGHSDRDRSLSVKPDKDAPEGFVVHSFSGDDPMTCRDYVRKKLGLSDPKENKRNGAGKSWTTLSEHIYRNAAGQPYLRVRKMRDANGKKQYPQFHWDGHQWIKGAPKTPKIPYRLPQLLAASPTTVIHFCEGEKDCDNLAELGFVATTQSGGASAPWDGALTQHFRNRHVVVLPDADKVGRKYAQQVAKSLHGVAASIRVIDLHPDHNGGRDVTDWLAAEANAGVKLPELAQDVALWQPASDSAGDEVGDDKSDAEITRLAKLSALQYEQERKGAVERLKVRASILDRLVQAERANLGLGQSAGEQGQAISFPEPEPWPQPVNGAALLDEIAAALERYVIMDEQARYSIALWIVHTYLLDCFMISPRLAVRSPMKRCGKTTLLDALGCLVMKALPTANVSAAALFRVVEAYRPTLLVDEADTFLAGADELRGVLNSGHRRGGSVLRTVGDDHEPRAFATYAAVAIGIIGTLPDTLADRSISVDLKRKLASETTESFRIDRVGHLKVLGRKTARWASDNASQIAAVDPKMPDGVHSRMADNWRCLFSIAEAAGGEWPNRVRAGATQAAAASETASQIELLLGDIRDAFAKREIDKVEPVDRMPSGDLVAALVGIEGRPWAELGKARKPLTQNRLARLLKPLVIAPDSVRIDEKTPKGYYLSQFKEAFARYLGPEGGSKPQQRNNPDEMGTSAGFQSATDDPDVADRKCEKPANDGACCGVADQKGVSGEEHEVCTHCGQPGGDEVSFNGRTARLHRECRTAFRDQPKPYRVVGSTPPGANCVACHSAEGRVLKIRRAEPGAKAETLHERCAAEWFAI